MYKTYIVKVCV